MVRLAFPTVLMLLVWPICELPAETWPGETWEQAAPEDVGMAAAELHQARDYALTGDGSGMITRKGKLVLAWGDQEQKYDLKSSTKSIGAAALGVAIGDGKLKLADKAIDHHPEFGVPPPENARWREEVTLLHLATQTAGFAKPGGYEKILFQPGTHWLYSDGGPNWLAECVTLAYRRDVEELMFQRVFNPLGIRRSDLFWRKNQYRPHMIDGIPRREFGAGVHANVNAMARIALLHLRRGRWRDAQLIPADYIDLARRPVKSVAGLPVWKGDPHGNASDHYGLLWWNNADGSLRGVPRDAYWSWGLYDSLMIVIPSLDIAAVRAGRSWDRKSDEHYAVLAPFLAPICASVKSTAEENETALERGADNKSPANSSPYPPSPVIRSIAWAPASTIVRQAQGSDNWPITWGDDDALYAAYGDGNGFTPRTKEKLSLGLARITGGPDDFCAENLRSNTAEQKGDGAKGKKASGVLMVDGALCMWARNAGNSQLGCSHDRGRTWQWCDWRFTESFGCPTFLNFGRNYAGARDEFVYIYSHDHDSAYEPADGIVLARVPQSKIREQEAYEFFAGLDDNGRPQWTGDIASRKPAFEHRDRCYRVSVSYNAGLQRYLLRHTHPEGEPRFSGGFSIYDAPEPWGPWTTVFYTDQWDVGPGETGAFPTKWMSDDGREITMVFSGDDSFSVRKVVLNATAE